MNSPSTREIFYCTSEALQAGFDIALKLAEFVDIAITVNGELTCYMVSHERFSSAMAVMAVADEGRSG